MASSLPGYDQWLTQPFEDAIADSDRFWGWAEAEGYDLEDPADMKNAEAAFEGFLEASYEDEMISRYEDAMDRKYDEMQERGWDDRW